jgi:uncharacterized protein
MNDDRTRLTLITGASLGIGRSFAEKLAARGDDLVLVARDATRLGELADRLTAEHGVRADVLSADLATSDGVKSVEAVLSDTARPVDVLVNNAGVGSYGKFAELPVNREIDEIELNVVALARLSHAALPGMIERRRGGIINVSSMASFQPMPYNATYGATKAFVTSFSHALHDEARGTGVNVLVLCPGFTRTDFPAAAGMDPSVLPSFVWLSADAVAESGINAFERGHAECVPGLANRMTGWLAAALPAVLTARFSGIVASRVEPR